MALVFMDGFDYYSVRADLVDSDMTTPNGALELSWNPTSGRGSVGNCLFANSSSGQDLEMPIQAAVGTTLYFNFALYLDGEFVSAATTIFSLRSAGTTSSNVFALGIAGAQSIAITPNSGTVYYSAAKTMMSRVWNNIELSVTLGTNGTNGAFELRINGIVAASASGIDTFVDAAGVSMLRLSSISEEVAFDDFVCFTSAGAAPNSWLGDTRVYTLLPNGDGAVVDWTANTGTDWQAVDEASADGDTTYIASSTVGQKSRFTMTDLPANCTVHGVEARIWAKKTNVNARSVRSYIRSSSSESNGITHTLPTDYHSWRSGYFGTDPNGGGAWTQAAVDALEVGVEVVS